MNDGLVSIKKITKKVLPSPLLQILRRALGKDDPSRYASLPRYKGRSETVLQCCISYNRHGGYCVPLSSLHRPATQKILSGRVWEPKTIEFITSHCGSGDVIHAGTYFGDFVPALSRKCSPHAKIWAFEPHPESHQCALITIALNSLRNVELINAGLGSQQSSMSLVVADQAGQSFGGGSKLAESEDDFVGQAIEVKILRIDDVIPPDRNVSIIQLDVEGFEQQALEGAIATIKRCKPILILESLPHEDWLSANLLPIGYKITGKIHANSILSIS
ncbi:MAG: FkbM family methyltransferase [Drouetiella hepatica Uher 2000/2452]|jgi:FkbM family methyltransferase|uniref:FkbM family methyltransferase n=1 Tax=Drouetiella hepatica Uher 2000/2452 TaxID=904376 RepID=A0A951UN38_9CYAN|nr:FkbM family methyltransferase [Drouetiella hepatica Uher 2000/2452]